MPAPAAQPVRARLFHAIVSVAVENTIAGKSLINCIEYIR